MNLYPNRLFQKSSKLSTEKMKSAIDLSVSAFPGNFGVQTKHSSKNMPQLTNNQRQTLTDQTHNLKMDAPSIFIRLNHFFDVDYLISKVPQQILKCDLMINEPVI